MSYLEGILNEVSPEAMPVEWQWRAEDLYHFSQHKKLYHFQQEALENAAKGLWLYYGDHKNDLTARQELRSKYTKAGCKSIEELDINRMGFWMATGSGKTLVTIKLIEMLATLIENDRIPNHEIMFLVYRQHLIKQFKDHVTEYNASNPKWHINLINLKDYERLKHGLALPRTGKVVNIFYYRADLFDKAKATEKRINPKSCMNDGKWYVLLDEAHRGDSTSSKLQQIYTEFSSQGFLFNFSATFIDDIDKDTCAYNFNLERFVRDGYGKQLYVSDYSIKGFKDQDEFSPVEKQKIVIRTLILNTYISQHFGKVRKQGSNLYHNPLMLAIVNSVNTISDKPSDLKLFFDELERFAREKDKAESKAYMQQFARVRTDLAKELEQARYVFGGESLALDAAKIKEISYQDVLQSVFNTSTPGGIEALLIPRNKQEIVLKMKTSDTPFSLIRIGDISRWVKKHLNNYEQRESYKNSSYFNAINEGDSNLKILMGSRAFYEGWDSNRPNIILFINIGITRDAKKFVMQSVGRGVRIEPEPGKRKRLAELVKSKELSGKINYKTLEKDVAALESLFIYGTDAQNLRDVVNTFKTATHSLGESFVINPMKDKYPLLMPTYDTLDKLIVKTDRNLPLHEKDFAAALELFNSLSNEMLLFKYECLLDTLKLMRKELKDLRGSVKYPRLNDPDLALQRMFDYFGIKQRAFDKFKQVGDEDIVHFKHIRFTGTHDDYETIKEKIKLMSDKGKQRAELVKTLSQEGADPEEIADAVTEQADLFAAASLYKGEIDIIGDLAEHFYHPLLVSKEDKMDYLTHIIKVQSERDFIDLLKQATKKKLSNGKRNNQPFPGLECEWWMFSKLDESKDKIYIPYFSPTQNRFANFYPDFIFWLKEKDSDNYHILFVDPKGSKHTGYEYKLKGYESFFKQARKVKEFPHDGKKIKVHLKFFGADTPPPATKDYWFNKLENLKL